MGSKGLILIICLYNYLTKDSKYYLNFTDGRISDALDYILHKVISWKPLHNYSTLITPVYIFFWSNDIRNT